MKTINETPKSAFNIDVFAPQSPRFCRAPVMAGD